MAENSGEDEALKTTATAEEMKNLHKIGEEFAVTGETDGESQNLRIKVTDVKVTGGKVVVLGTTGKNFAAGMSGGIAYVLDMGNDLYKRLNKEMISIEAVTDKYEVSELKQLIMDHVNYTNSEIGKRILEDFEGYLPKFKKIIPKDYKKMMNMIVAFEEKGLSREKAAIEAFYKVKNGGK